MEELWEEDVELEDSSPFGEQPLADKQRQTASIAVQARKKAIYFIKILPLRPP